MSDAAEPIVLILDDDTGAREALATLLREDGFPALAVAPGTLGDGSLKAYPQVAAAISVHRPKTRRLIERLVELRRARPRLAFFPVDADGDLEDRLRRGGITPRRLFSSPLPYEELLAALREVSDAPEEVS